MTKLSLSGRSIRAAAPWCGALLIVAVIVWVPFAYYRAQYDHAKRLRVVTDARFYRSGQLTANGFEDAFRRFGIKTVVNLQDEAKDPLIPRSWKGKPVVNESDLCKKFGVNYVSLDGNVIDYPEQNPTGRPKLIAEFLDILHKPDAYPILIHCKAGLHRTGFMTAIYRMEMEDRTKDDVVRELRGNGFGTFGATDGNIYLQTHILDFRPTKRPEAEPKR